MRKSKKSPLIPKKIPEINDFEVKLAKKIALFPLIVNDASKNLYPSAIASYAYELAQSFNEFYQAVSVIGSKEESFRILLVHSFRHTIKNALALLGIQALEEM